MASSDVPQDPDAPDDPTPPKDLRVAVGLLGLEALALIGLAAFLVVDTVSGASHSIAGALFGALLVLLVAAFLALGARGLLRLRPAARTPVVVLQILALPVSYSLGFQAGRIAIGGPILIVALLVLYLLFTPPSRAALDRDISR